jgi:hypothetical protein
MSAPVSHVSSAAAAQPSASEESCRADRGRGWISFVVLSILLAAVAAFQSKVVRKQALWADEVFSLAMATGHSVEHPAAAADRASGDFVVPETPVPASVLRQYLQHRETAAGVREVARAVFLSDTSPPLYYVLLNLWTRRLGVTDADVRSLSVGFALLSVVLLFVVTRELAGTSAARLGAVLWSVSPAFLYYGGEARMYPILWCCLLASAYAALCFGKGSWSSVFLWATSVAAGLLTHYFFLFPCFAFVVYACVTLRGHLRWRFLGATVAAGVLVAPWYINLPASLGLWRITHEWLSVEPHGFDRLWAVVKIPLQWFSGEGQYLWWPNPRAEALALALTLIIAVLYSRRCRIAAPQWPLLLPLLWFAAGCAGPVVFDAVRGTYTSAVLRYSITALPAAIMLLAASLAPHRTSIQVLLATALVGCWIPQAAGMLQDPDRNDQNYWLVAWHLERRTSADDLILIHSIPTGAMGVARYANPAAPMAVWVQQLGVQQVPQTIERLVAGRRRVFYLDVHSVGAPAPEKDWLEQNGELIQQTRLGNAWLSEFAPRNAPSF